MPNPLAGSVGILGGTFNPVHNGHLRMALEAREALGLARVDLMPARIPPHKGEVGLLDFDTRLGLLREAVEGVDGLGASDFEGGMPVPSYSFATLTRLRELAPNVNHVFILGSTDLLTLPEWHRGLELPLLADLAVVDRMGIGLDRVDGFLDEHWRFEKEGPGLRRIAGGRLVAFVSMPRQDISASMVRDKFCAGLETSGLVPEAVRRRLRGEPRVFLDCWQSQP
ncbi:nicotinate-nicotinamide nucleotide adenylyltransferase [Desulfomicrobium salsuginis]